MPKDADLAFSAALFEKAESLYTLISKYFSCFCVSPLAYAKVRCVFIYYMILLGYNSIHVCISVKGVWPLFIMLICISGWKRSYVLMVSLMASYLK